MHDAPCSPVGRWRPERERRRLRGGLREGLAARFVGRERTRSGIMIAVGMPREWRPADRRQVRGRDRLWLGGLAAAVVLLATLARTSAGDEPLPTDPSLVRGTLDNGLAYIVKPHRTPPDRVSLWLQVSTGSLNETDETRGISHYLEHLAFNGSANFPPGSVVPYFESLGLSFGRDQNAFTSFDQTVYQLALPDATRETLDKGLLFLSDVAFRLSLLPSEIESERQIVLEEMRARAGAWQRVRDQVYERLAPELTFGRRLPIGTEATIRSVTVDDFRAYYRERYVPSNMTLLVVGDSDPALVAELIAERFGEGPRVPRPVPREIGTLAPQTNRAIVVTDPELTHAALSIVRLEPPRGAATTVSQERRDLIDALGVSAFNRRMRTLVAEGQVAFLEARASAREWPRALRTAAAEASGDPGAWRAILRDLGTEVERARRHGFGEHELEDARVAVLAEAEEAVQRESTLPARAVLGRLNSAVALGRPLMSAAQRLDLLRRLLPGITPAEVSGAFASVFTPGALVFVAELPSGGDVPDEPELLAVGRAAVNVTPEPLVLADRPASLLAELPPAGLIVEQREHAPSGVTSVWLDNGVRAHHRFMDEHRADARVVITLAGGRIQESAANRGITDAAAVAWERPATRTLSSTQVRVLMTGRKVRVSGQVGDDALTLTVSGDPAELEAGLQLAYLLLTDPLVEGPALEQWKVAESQAIAARKVQPAGVLAEALAAALYPEDEARTRPLEVEQVRAISLDDANAWLRQLVARSPIEVAVVGDLDRASALALVRRYLGGLPARDRIGDKTLEERRAIRRIVGPVQVERIVDVKTPQSFVLDGFFGPDLRDTRDARLLTMAARILSTRLTRTIREERQLVYSIRALSQPASEYPGFGSFVAQAPTDPSKGQVLATALEEMYTAFATDGPTPAELEVARKQIANQLAETMKDPGFWTQRLAVLDYRGLSLTDLVEAPARYQAFTADEIREAFARYYQPEARFRIVILPRQG
jgi:zinc protease